MEAEVRELLATIQEPHLRACSSACSARTRSCGRATALAPAAKYYHQAYAHGLLEHSLGVAQAVSAISATFPGIDRDVAVTGALLHDIGKLEAYTRRPAEHRPHRRRPAARRDRRSATTASAARSRTSTASPQELAQAVRHIILSHHGTLEHGSPVVPCTREATLVHMIDNLGGRLGSFDRLEKELAPGRRWSSFDRAIGGGAFFADRGGEEGGSEPPDRQPPAREAA